MSAVPQSSIPDVESHPLHQLHSRARLLVNPYAPRADLDRARSILRISASIDRATKNEPYYETFCSVWESLDNNYASDSANTPPTATRVTIIGARLGCEADTFVDLCLPCPRTDIATMNDAQKSRCRTHIIQLLTAPDCLETLTAMHHQRWMH